MTFLFRTLDSVARFAQVGLVEPALRASYYGWPRAKGDLQFHSTGNGRLNCNKLKKILKITGRIGRLGGVGTCEID